MNQKELAYLVNETIYGQIQVEAARLGGTNGLENVLPETLTRAIVTALWPTIDKMQQELESTQESLRLCADEGLKPW